MARPRAPFPPGRVLISKARIAARVRSLGREIARHFNGERPIVLGVMNGSLFFLADLLRAVDLDVEVATVRLVSYAGTRSTGRVRGLGSFRDEVRGRRVLVVDDILDTGRTLGTLRKRLLAFGAVDVQVCVLLAKRRSREVTVEAKWIGFWIEDEFVVGYGLDHDGRYRNLKEVRVLKSAS